MAKNARRMGHPIVVVGQRNQEQNIALRFYGFSFHHQRGANGFSTG